jgi:hypothetical protein
MFSRTIRMTVPVSVKAVTRAHLNKRHMSNNFLQEMLQKENVQHRIRTVATNYVKFIKWPIGVGSVVGFVFGTAYAMDQQDKRRLSRVETLGYPIGGTLAGAGVGATFPFWLVFAPVSYALGNDTASAIFKALLAGALLLNDSDKKK